MGQVKEINIKNRTNYFFNDMINIEHFDSNLLKTEKNSCKNNGIYNIGYITIKKLMIMKIFTVQFLCIWLLVRQIDLLKEKNGSKYLVFDAADENKEVLKKQIETLWWD